MSVQRDRVKSVLEDNIHNAHAVLLDEHGLETGDIAPAEQARVDEAIESLTDATVQWLENRLAYGDDDTQYVVMAPDGSEVFAGPFDDEERARDARDNYDHPTIGRPTVKPIQNQPTEPAESNQSSGLSP